MLDKHGPWILYQEGWKSSPWVTNDTVELIKNRNKATANALKIVKAEDNPSEAWKSQRF